MSEEFVIKPNMGAFLRLFFHSQLFITPQYPTQSFAGQTVIVTGANSGLGLESARHFYRLNCAKLIIAVRTVSKGEEAKEDILKTVKQRTDADAIEVWALDLASTVSTVAFAERVIKELGRVDVVVENAGIRMDTYGVYEGLEQTMQVNVINTALLGLLLLPKLEETAQISNSTTHLTVVASEAHHLTTFPQINSPDIYERLNDKASYVAQTSYEISKLIEILFVRELTSRLKTTNLDSPSVIINTVNPGLCFNPFFFAHVKSPVAQFGISITMKLFARTREVGSRTIVTAASAGVEAHGEYMSDGKIQRVEEWIYTDVGRRVQEKVWEQTMKVIEGRVPGVGKAAGM